MSVLQTFFNEIGQSVNMTIKYGSCTAPPHSDATCMAATTQTQVKKLTFKFKHLSNCFSPTSTTHEGSVVNKRNDK